MNSTFLSRSLCWTKPAPVTHNLNPLALLDISEAVLDLASAILQAGIIPAKAARDAAHNAVSAVHGLDFLLTWNCAHIANSQIVKNVQTICSRHGFPCPLICTPEELMGELA